MDLYLLIGQSNMAGRGVPDSLSNITDPAIWMLDRNGRWVPAKDPLHFDKKEAGVGPGFAFAKEMLPEAGGHRIGLIPCAVGGTSISRWQPGSYDPVTRTHPYDDAIKRAKLAMKSGQLKGILWHQGESDSGASQYLYYRQRFDSLLLNLSADLDIAAGEVPMVVGQVGDFFVAKNPEGHGKDINAILRQIAADHKNMAWASSEGLTDKGDKTHFDTNSARELGKRFARAMLQLQQKMKK